MEFFLIFIVLLIVIYYFYRISRPEYKVRILDSKAQQFLNSYRSTSKAIYGQEQMDEEILMMSDWYAILKNRFEEDKDKLVELANDWLNYILYKQQHSTGVYLWLDEQDIKEAQGRDKEIRDNIFKYQEIENRFAHNLGSEYEKKLKEHRDKREKESKEFSL